MGNALIEAINSLDAAVRRASMQALGQLRYRMAEQALSDQFSYYQRGPDAAAALAGLAGIAHQTSASRFRELLGSLESPDGNFRRLAVEGIARSGDKSLQADLDRLGQAERSAPVLLALHYASVRLGTAGAPDQLVASLRDPALRQQAQYYLLDLGRSIGSVAQTLSRFLQDPNADTRATVADILGFSGDTQVIPALEVATRDADPSAAAAAQRAVERIKKTRS
jgi:HEAT repeat protein